MSNVSRQHLVFDGARTANVTGENSEQVIVLHTTESSDAKGISDVVGVIKYLKRNDLGVHYCVDADGNVGRGAYHKDRVSHARGANSRGIGIEMIGRAKFSMKDWVKRRKQLNAVAHLVAYIADREKIPLVLSTTHGVARHSDFPAGGHWDPGPGFPMGYILKRARKILRKAKAS